jgi:hypothetical protein
MLHPLAQFDEGSGVSSVMLASDDPIVYDLSWQILQPISRPVRRPVDSLTGQNDNLSDGNLQAVSTSLCRVRQP